MNAHYFVKGILQGERFGNKIKNKRTSIVSKHGISQFQTGIVSRTRSNISLTMAIYVLYC